MTQPVPLLVVDLDSTVRHGFGELGRFVNGPDDVVIFPEVPHRLLAWKYPRLGRVLGVSNQGGVGLGFADRDLVSAGIQRTIAACDEGLGATPVRPTLLPLLDAVSWCPHDPAENCWCRKPMPGGVIDGIRQLEARFPGECYPWDLALFVGDRPEDEACAGALHIRFQWAAEWRASTLCAG